MLSVTRNEEAHVSVSGTRSKGIDAKLKPAEKL